MSEPHYISVKKAQEVLGVSRQTVMRRLEDGTFTRYAVGGLLRLDLNEIHDVMRASANTTD
ncbi:helix-turn-helix domain-containing protein [Corynebacterium variabile]|uniref:Uncharacterized protein n=1 Tax=Corynebacterium variabile TaxID=1727 RepID=A0A4Y4C6X4_9CORY|nr:helix-turn-helix domain-containing protein [Corynebacterium variabile]GEC87184.1 hypothetical protein CVA01_24980 [Corynebacterium variabile]